MALKDAGALQLSLSLLADPAHLNATSYLEMHAALRVFAAKLAAQVTLHPPPSEALTPQSSACSPPSSRRRSRSTRSFFSLFIVYIRVFVAKLAAQVTLHPQNKPDVAASELLPQILRSLQVLLPPAAAAI